MNIHNILVLSRFHKFWDKLDFSHRSIRKEHTIPHGFRWGVCLNAGYIFAHEIWRPNTNSYAAILLFLSALVGWHICSVINHWIHSPSQATTYVRHAPLWSGEPRPVSVSTRGWDVPPPQPMSLLGGHLVKNSTRTQKNTKFQRFTS